MHLLSFRNNLFGDSDFCQEFVFHVCIDWSRSLFAWSCVQRSQPASPTISATFIHYFFHQSNIVCNTKIAPMKPSLHRSGSIITILHRHCNILL